MNSQNFISIESSTLKDGTPYDIVFLGRDHAAFCAALHQQIIDGLPDDEKGFILAKPASYFEDHMAKGSGNAVIGVIINGFLAGQAVIHHPTIAHPDTGMVDMILPEGSPEDFSVLQAASVHPDFRGMSLMDKMVKCWIDYAHDQGKTHLLAEVDIRNVASWNSFLKNGLHIASFGCDPEDGTQLYNLHETTANAKEFSLAGAFNHASAVPPEHVPLAQTEQQKSLLAAGYIGAAWKKATQALVFVKPSAPPAVDTSSFPVPRML